MTDPLSPEALNARAKYYEDWARDIRGFGGASVDADYSAETAAVLRALASRPAPSPSWSARAVPVSVGWFPNETGDGERFLIQLEVNSPKDIDGVPFDVVWKGVPVEIRPASSMPALPAPSPDVAKLLEEAERYFASTPDGQLSAWWSEVAEALDKEHPEQESLHKLLSDAVWGSRLVDLLRAALSAEHEARSKLERDLQAEIDSNTEERERLLVEIANARGERDAALARAAVAEEKLRPGSPTERAPTVDAYEAACEALEKHRAHAVAAEADARALREKVAELELARLAWRQDAAARLSNYVALADSGLIGERSQVEVSLIMPTLAMLATDAESDFLPRCVVCGAAIPWGAKTVAVSFDGEHVDGAGCAEHDPQLAIYTNDPIDIDAAIAKARATLQGGAK